ncbi:MAG TPA: ATP-binding protein [Candidatus Deferrimicrobium sp.]|nr:ATP-binding protein [Candidatus Deferrimicrobium sp.]
MRPNPGGALTGEAIVDRKNEIASIWRALQNQSVVISSERRVGKTCILRKMEEKPRDGWTPLLYIVEGKEHPVEFIEGLYEELLRKNIRKDNFHKLKKLYNQYVGGENILNLKFPEIKKNWKQFLESIIEDIIDTNQKVLLMFDELPLMLSMFIKSSEIGHLGTMGFLDTLRELRNKYEASKNISFIFCGSVGIQLIIKDLKRNHGYNSDPINNMKIISISSMDKEGAVELCQKLGEDTPFQLLDKDKMIDYICRETDRLPFYIQHVFDYFYESGEKEITKKQVDEAIGSLLSDPKDVGFFRHYLDRIKTYYDQELQKIALLILDKTCQKENYWEENDIINEVKSHLQVDAEPIKEALDLIWSDHYLVRELRNNRRIYKFKYSILRKWWKINRG